MRGRPIRILLGISLARRNGGVVARACANLECLWKSSFRSGGLIKFYIITLVFEMALPIS